MIKRSEKKKKKKKKYIYIYIYIYAHTQHAKHGDMAKIRNTSETIDCQQKNLIFFLVEF